MEGRGQGGRQEAGQIAAGDPGKPDARRGGGELPLQVTPGPPACTTATTKDTGRNSPSQAAGKRFFPLLTEPGCILGPQAPRSPSQSSFSLVSELPFIPHASSSAEPPAPMQQRLYRRITPRAMHFSQEESNSHHSTFFFLTQKWHLQKSSSFITKI